MADSEERPPMIAVAFSGSVMAADGSDT